MANQDVPNNSEQVVPSSNPPGHVILLQPVTVTTSSFQRQADVPVSNELYLAIFNALFCCLCLGVPAIILANQANNLRTTDPVRARGKAEAARILNIMSIVLGIIVLITVIVIYVRVYSFML